MSLSRLLAVPLLLSMLAFPSCRLIDLEPHAHGVVSDGFISAHATAGWPERGSPFKILLFEGRNQGAFFYLNVWKLLRVELGVVGVSLGLGPLDAGFGVLFYDAFPPDYGPWGGDGDDDAPDAP